jgi:hypothetical protein
VRSPRSSRNWPSGRGSIRTGCRPTCCVTPSPAICWPTGPTCAPCSRCWATPTSPPTQIYTHVLDERIEGSGSPGPSSGGGPMTRHPRISAVVPACEKTPSDGGRQTVKRALTPVEGARKTEQDNR